MAQKVDAQEYSSFEQTAGQAFISDSLAGHGKFTSWGHETLLSLSGGFLGCSNLVCSAADFTQTGGTLWVTNVMSVSGNYCGGGDYSCSATYSCTNGNLIANAMQVLGRFMFAGGVASIANSVGFVGSPTFGLVVQNSFSGGILTCANMTSAFRDLTISGSTVVVSNLLSFSGLIANYGLPPPAGYASLSISAGSLTASNISIAASMYIHTGTGRITNAGVFYLSGYLSTTDASERLGRFSLQAGSQPGFVSISFGGTTNRLSFNDSSSQTWSAGETLFLKSWSGSTNGGGDDQLKFGTTAGGLTAAQLAQIQFIDPAGFAPGTYNAKILNTGEVVPTILPLLYPATGTGKIILTWSNATVLQTATNVAGPYLDIPGATSPYTNPIAGDKQRYFRLRQ